MRHKELSSQNKQLTKHKHKNPPKGSRAKTKTEKERETVRQSERVHTKQVRINSDGQVPKTHKQIKMKIKIFPLTADAATLAQQQQRQQQQQRRRRSVMKLQRKHKMPEICSWLIVAAAATAASATWLTLAGIGAVAAQEDDISDSEMHQHHMDLLHHQQQHSDFIIGESEERDHIAHHLGELSNGNKCDMKL